MPMSWEQAADLLAQIEAGYGKKLSNDERKEYIRHLKALNFELAEKAVWEVVDRSGTKSESLDLRYFPKFGAFKQVYHEVAGEGHANAMGSSPSSGAKVDAWDVFLSDQITSMPDEAYWAYLYDEDARNMLHRHWRDAFMKMQRGRSA